MKILCMSGLLFFILFNTNPNQTNQIPRVIFHSSDLYSPSNQSTIVKISKNEGGKNIITWDTDGNKSKINKDSIWGIIDEKNSVYRLYKHLFYKVADTTSYIRYEINRGSRYGRVIVSKKFNYYSKTLDSDLYDHLDDVKKNNLH